MLGSGILEVAIGVCFLFLLLSTICSAIQEWIATALQARAKTLAQGVRQLLGDPAAVGLAKAVTDHPLLKGLGDPSGRGPSYIPSRTFALALLDTIAPGETKPDGIRAALDKAQDTPVRRALLLAIQHAGGKFEEVRASVERWFDDGMSRVSGWYKRKAQLRIFGVATLVVLAVNADTLLVVRMLSRDPKVRAVSAEAAASWVKNGATAPASAPSTAGLERLRKELEASSLPIGWTCDSDDPRVFPSAPGGVVLRFVGWLLSVIAVSLGAPFWFQLLNRFVDIRGAGAKPKSS